MSTKTESSPQQLQSCSSRPRSLSLLCVNRLPNKKMDPQAPQPPQTPSTPRSKPHEGSYLSQLLPGTTEWPHSDEALSEALKLRQEQERTKQEFYRLENRKRTLEILTMATHAGVPGNAIASLFEGQGAAQTAAQMAAQVASNPSKSSRSRAQSPELVNYEEATKRSPTRFRPAHNRSASAVTTFSSQRPVTQAYYPRQIAPQNSSLQFHHWKPNQRPEDKRKAPAATATSPKQHAKHEEQPSPSPAPAAVVAAAHQQQRRSNHSRHRSEAAIPLNRNWNFRQEEGASILASMATERNKHDVGYILAPDRSPYGKMPQSSPPQQQAGLQRPPFGFPGQQGPGQPGPGPIAQGQPGPAPTGQPGPLAQGQGQPGPVQPQGGQPGPVQPQSSSSAGTDEK